MKVPRRKKPIDIDALRKAMAAGSTLWQFAKRHGFSPNSVARACRVHKIKRTRRERQVRDRIDRRLHSIWRYIHERCANRRSPQFKHYGAKGVRVCAEWNEFPVFRDWARTSGYEIGKALALRVRSRGYRPSNCEWVDRVEAIQRGLTELSNSTVTIRAFGETKSALAWSRDKRCAVSDVLLRRRIANGIPARDAITLPPRSVRLEPVAPRRAANRTIDWDRARELYVGRGLDVKQTTAKLGASYHAILRGLRRRGMLRERPTPIAELKHGPRIYKAWNDMRGRCKSVRSRDYAAVGGKGIRVHPSWSEFRAFHEWALKSGYRTGLTLTRLDRTKDYTPKNCRWMSRRAAIEFKRPENFARKPRWTITAWGETKGPVEWTRDRRCKVGYAALVERLRKGMVAWRAISAASARNRH